MCIAYVLYICVYQHCILCTSEWNYILDMQHFINKINIIIQAMTIAVMPDRMSRNH